MKDIFEQLKAEGQRCQPEFSESLHARCIEAIDQIEAAKASEELRISSRIKKNKSLILFDNETSVI